MTKFSITFLTQEEPESGDADDRKILTQGCPSMGVLEFESEATSAEGLFLEFQNFMKANCENAVLDKVHFPQIQQRSEID